MLIFFSVFLIASFPCCLQAELMKKKLPWLKYDLKKTEYQDAKKRETESKKKLDEAAKILSDLKAPIEYVLKPSIA